MPGIIRALASQTLDFPLATAIFVIAIQAVLVVVGRRRIRIMQATCTHENENDEREFHVLNFQLKKGDVGVFNENNLVLLRSALVLESRAENVLLI
jgi:hypothetical protein